MAIATNKIKEEGPGFSLIQFVFATNQLLIDDASGATYRARTRLLLDETENDDVTIQVMAGQIENLGWQLLLYTQDYTDGNTIERVGRIYPSKRELLSASMNAMYDHGLIPDVAIVA